MAKIEEEFVALLEQQAEAVQHDTEDTTALREQLATAQQNTATLQRIIVDEATTLQKMLKAQNVLNSTEISNHPQSQTLAVYTKALSRIGDKSNHVGELQAKVARLEATVAQLQQEIRDKKSVEELVKGLPSLVGSVSLGEKAINEIAAKVSEAVRSSFPPSNPPSRHVGGASESLPITRKRPRQEANLHATEPNPPSDPEAAAFDHVLEELVTNLHKFPLRVSPKGNNPVDIRILIGDLVKYILYPTSRRFLEEFLETGPIGQEVCLKSWANTKEASWCTCPSTRSSCIAIKRWSDRAGDITFLTRGSHSS